LVDAELIIDQSPTLVEADVPLLTLLCKLGYSEATTLLLRSLNFVLQTLGAVGRNSSSVEFRLILIENDLPPLLRNTGDAVERNVVLHVRHALEMFVKHITLASVYIEWC
jgi:hypothetical protein